MKKYSKKQLDYWMFLKGRKLSEETKKKMSVSGKKSKNSGRFKKGCQINLGRKRPDMIGNKFSGGKPSWNKGKKTSDKTKLKLSIAHKGKPAYWNREEKSSCWKGNDVGYSGVHYWARKYKGKPEKCILCNKIGEKKGRRWSIEWANIDHKYRRKLEDYIPLCPKCHRKYDKENNN